MGSWAGRRVAKLAAFRRARKQLGLLGALKGLVQNRKVPLVEPRLAGVRVLEYDCVNGGRTLLEILRRPGSLVLLAGCGAVDPAFLAVVEGRCLVGHPLDGAEAPPPEVAVQFAGAARILRTAAITVHPGESSPAYRHRLALAQADLLAEAAVSYLRGEPW